ncbi:TadE/TadG family type IV pilus assembly protein [Cryptosporangium sp. NPDC048952]|uniref:TadE/TadG family type IV pilus assembly protein n=1 Tax=Cryptosporangium sp. NPDC048952 TaxID=3363961 RepID=UPI00371D7246
MGSGKERGAAAIELAIIMPILLVMIFGIIDFGRVINTQMTLTEASREAARALAFGQTPANTLARAQLVTGTTDTQIASSTACPPTATVANTASVTLKQTYTYITPIMGLLGTAGSTRTLQSTGVMACVG